MNFFSKICLIEDHLSLLTAFKSSETMTPNQCNIVSEHICHILFDFIPPSVYLLYEHPEVFLILFVQLSHHIIK